MVRSSSGPRRAARGWLVALAIAAAAPSARADEGEVIGVLRVDTSGVSDSAGLKFEQGVTDGLRGAGFQVMDSTSMAKALTASGSYVDGCTFGPCLSAVHQASGVRLILIARIEGVGRTYSFVVSLIDSRTGELTSQVAQSCPVCTVEDAITTATLSTIELVLGVGAAKVTDPRAGPTRTSTGAAFGPGQRGGVERGQRALRRTGWIGIVAGLGAGLGGAWLLSDDRDLGGPLLGGGAALVVAGGLMVWQSSWFDD